MFWKKIFLFVFSLFFFVLTEPAVAKMNRAPANPISPVPSNYPIRQLAGDIDDVHQWLREGLRLQPCQPAPDNTFDDTYSTLQEIQKQLR